METLAYTHLCLVSEPVETNINISDVQFKRTIYRGLFPLILFGAGCWNLQPALAALNYGQRGATVVQLQNQLKQLGYFPKKVESTGYYGTVTRDAVIKFQRDHRLPADGVVGAQTLAALQTTNPAPSPVTATTPPTSQPPVSVPTDLPTLKLGSQGQAVELVQLQLTVFGYYRGEINGKFTNATQAAVIKFQKEVNLPPDGVVGRTTHERLYQLEQKVFS